MKQSAGIVVGDKSKKTKWCPTPGGGERMEKAKVIELKETILEDNNADAQVLRQELKAQKTCLMNLMSSPGSGKTSTLLALKPHFEGKIKWGRDGSRY